MKRRAIKTALSAVKVADCLICIDRLPAAVTAFAWATEMARKMKQSITVRTPANQRFCDGGKAGDRAVRGHHGPAKAVLGCGADPVQAGGVRRPSRPSPGSFNAGWRRSRPTTAPSKFTSSPSTQPSVRPA